MAKRSFSKVPEIRFKGFEDEWEEKMLGSVVNVTTGKLDANAMTSDGIYDFYTSGIKKYKIDVAAFTGPSITIAGNGATVGYMHLADGEFNAYQRTYVLNNFTADRRFVYYSTGIRLPKKISEEARTGNIPYIVRDMLTELGLSIPTPTEQTKIGEFFRELDQLIALHQQKHDKLVTLKKSMLQKMFAQPGATTPEIRFKGFSVAWVEKKLGKAGEFNPREALPEIFEYVDLESVVGTEMVSHRTETRKTAPSRAQRLARQGDLFFQTVRPYQKNNHLFSLPFGNFVFSTGYAQIRPFDDGFFLLALMQRDEFVKVVLDNCTGTSYPAINSNVLAEIVINVPDPEEQQKIGTYFRTLDEIISKHAIQLAKLKQLKSACLERMFV